MKRREFITPGKSWPTDWLPDWCSYSLHLEDRGRINSKEMGIQIEESRGRRRRIQRGESIELWPCFSFLSSSPNKGVDVVCHSDRINKQEAPPGQRVVTPTTGNLARKGEEIENQRVKMSRGRVGGEGGGELWKWKIKNVNPIKC